MKSIEVNDGLYEIYEDCVNCEVSDSLLALIPIMEKVLAEKPFYIETLGDKSLSLLAFYEKKKAPSGRNTETGRIANNLRSRMSAAIKNNVKRGSSVKDLGCSIDEFKVYLEKSFYPNLKTCEDMTWDNYGLYGWHIDHIKPLVSFDLTNRDQFLEACHYTNLQPLWAEENLSKGSKQK